MCTVFKNLWQKNHQLQPTYLVDLSNIYSSNKPTSTSILCNLRTMLYANRYSTCLTKGNFIIRSEHNLQFKYTVM